ncbi:MAG: hypothetical protein ACTSRU_09140 [Candidatus Hodarchaeales archaeon]
MKGEEKESQLLTFLSNNDSIMIILYELSNSTSLYKIKAVNSFIIIIQKLFSLSIERTNGQCTKSLEPISWIVSKWKWVQKLIEEQSDQCQF